MRMRGTHLSQARRNQLAIIHSERIFTSSTVPGQIVINVFITNFVSKFIRFNAPIDRDEASVNSFECSNITRAIRYSLRNMGRERRTSMLTTLVSTIFPSWCIVVQVNLKSPGIGWIAHTKTSNVNWAILLGEMATRQSSTQLSTANSWNTRVTFSLVYNSFLQ